MGVTYLVTTGAGEMRGKGGGWDDASQELSTFGHDNSMVGMGHHTLIANMAQVNIYTLMSEHKRGEWV